MKIVCVIKAVPDPRTVVKALPDGSDIDRGAIKFVCDPFDEFGVELAVRLREQRSDVAPITAVAAGGAAAVEALRHAVAMGCDHAVCLRDDSLPMWDELMAARLVASLVRTASEGADLILCGKQSVDNDSGEFGPALAECLELPHVAAATAFNLTEDGRTATIQRKVDGADEVFEVSLPAVVTIEKGLVEPRRPSLPRIIKAKQAAIEVRSRDECEVRADSARLTLCRVSSPPSRPSCRMLDGEPAAMACELVRLLREEAGVL